jgi:hypothetical protein
MPGHDSKDWTVGLDKVGRSDVGIRAMEQDSWDRIGGTGQLGHDS